MPHDLPPLVGRASVVAEVVRRARAGQGSVLTGPPGSGGSRLLDEVQLAVRRVGSRTARLRVPTASTAGSPFLPLLDRAVLDLLPAGDRGALRAAVLDLGIELLGVEDAHLLGPEDGAIVVDLARAGAAVVANATGPGGMPDSLRQLIAEDRVVATPLGPLGDAEVTDLAEHLLGDPIDGDLVQALTIAAEGRPGTLSELIDDGVGARSIVHTDGLWRLTAPLPVARSVRTAVLDAFSALPPDQRGWIAAVATAGLLALDLAPRIATPETISAVAEGGWTVLEDTAARMASAPIGTAVLGSLDVRARIAVLRRLIDAAASVQRPLSAWERVAATRWQIDVGEAPDAAEALELALLPQTDSESREALLRAALDGGAPAGAALADHLRRTRRPKEALELIAAALPAAGSEDERASLIRVATMTTGIVERRSQEALDALDAHLATRCRHPDLLAVRAGLLLLEARPQESVDAALEVIGDESRSVFAAAFAHLQVAVGLRELGDLAGSLEAADRFTALHGVEQAYPAGAALAHWLPPEVAVAVGAELDPAATRLATAHGAIPRERRTRERPSLSYSLGCIRSLQADPIAAVRLLKEADGGSGAWRESWRPRILAELTIAQTLAGALDDASATHERLLQLVCPPVQQGRVRLATAQLTAARGDLAAAAAIAAAVADDGRERGLALDVFDGTFAAIRYGDPAAPARLIALGALPAGAGRTAQRAYAAAILSGDVESVDRAALGLWEAGLRVHAIDAASRAAELGSTVGAQHLVAWLARSPGFQLPGGGEGRSSRLTAREREVALLASQGVSDRLIATELGISLRTAQTHLGRALAKLGIHRRTELAALIDEP